MVYDEWRMEISDDIAYTELERGMMEWGVGEGVGGGMGDGG